MARGDHIKVRRCGGLYSHHGIDMGDGTVIHLAGEPFRNRGARVCRTDRADFLQGHEATVVSYSDGCRPAEDAAQTAEAHLGREGYCLWRNNCEHFASFCKTGNGHSRQILRAVRIGGAAAGALCVLALRVAWSRQQRAMTSRDT